MEQVRRLGMVVAIDGPAGSGKSSASRGVAERLRLRYLDTGAMYRAMTWWMLQHDVDLGDAEEIASHAWEPKIRVGTDPTGPTITLDGEDVSGPIRSREVTNAVSAVSAVPLIRQVLVEQQQDVIDDGAIVVEGRDIGTVVAPHAEVKIFLTADPVERARRRTSEGLAGEAVSADANQAEMARRDLFDSTKGAFAQALDAVVVDTTELSLDEVIDQICRLTVSRARIEPEEYA
ncbi:(d)CMP kinase [Tenggerimyces flavus]|uniref:Cytidylate kinase n=1 Tax=Tenggerimyces flavus TaxID=1708749 RepID=A0ABV7Y6Q2_9ACTN|nr:(d)CMP kinase [Tenggerimyces flavus]MBM7788499.1 cytidylate kinase [Tenggerimyces flavus]